MNKTLDKYYKAVNSVAKSLSVFEEAFKKMEEAERES